MKKFIALALVTLGITASARAQWIVYDAANTVQSVINTAQEIARGSTGYQQLPACSAGLRAKITPKPEQAGRPSSAALPRRTDTVPLSVVAASLMAEIRARFDVQNHGFVGSTVNHANQIIGPCIRFLAILAAQLARVRAAVVQELNLSKPRMDTNGHESDWLRRMFRRVRPRRFGDLDGAGNPGRVSTGPLSFVFIGVHSWLK